MPVREKHLDKGMLCTDMQSMHKAFKYRLYPSRPQRRVLAEHLEACRRLYNTFLCDRVQAYQDRGESLSLYDQLGKLPFLKEDWPPVAEVHSQVLQNVGVRVDLAFKAFFRRGKAGANPAFRATKAKAATIA